MGAFGNNPNQSGGSTASVLKAVREAAQTVDANTAPVAPSPAPAAVSSPTPMAPPTPSVAPTAASSPVPPPTPSAAPAAPIIPPSAPDDFDEDHDDEVPAAPIVAPSTAAPAFEVAREPSNSTSPGSASFAEAPSSIGREDDESDVASLLPKRSAGAMAFLRTPRNLALVAGGAVLVIILLAVAFRSGSKKPSASKKTPAVAETDKKATHEETTPAAPADPSPGGAAATDTPPADPATPSGAAATDTPPSSDPNETPPPGDTTVAQTPTPDTGKAATPTDPAAAKKPAPTLGGKQVVLEYDSQARDAQSIPNSAAKADQSAIAKARTSYAAGNQRLFAGDADGAVRYYRQALGYYPAYVAGYRGLGLAYAQQGNKAQALQAFRTYLGSVPNAKDAALIRKRITTLQSH